MQNWISTKKQACKDFQAVDITSTQDFGSLRQLNSIKGYKVAIEDANLAEKLYYSDIRILKGKSA